MSGEKKIGYISFKELNKFIRRQIYTQFTVSRSGASIYLMFASKYHGEWF